MSQNILSAYPDLNDIYAASRRGGEDAGEAVAAANLQGRVRVVSFDASDPLIADVKNCIVDVLVVQAPFKMGYDRWKAMVKQMRNCTRASNENTGVTLVTGKNINDPAQLLIAMR